MNMKKIIRIIIIAILATTFSINTVFADDTVYTDGDFNYVLNDDGSIKIINYFGDDKEAEIPRAIGVYKVGDQYVPRYVTIIAATTFESIQPENLIIPDTVVYIEQGAISENIDVQYTDEQGQIVEEENVNPIIINPSENPINTTNDEVFEEIGTEIDPETGEEKDIFEITGNDQIQDKDDVTEFERKGESTSDFDKITVSPFGYVLLVVVIIIAGYYVYKKYRNNKVTEITIVEEEKPQKKRKTTNKKSSTSKKKSATKTSSKKKKQ